MSVQTTDCRNAARILAKCFGFYLPSVYKVASRVYSLVRKKSQPLSVPQSGRKPRQVSCKLSFGDFVGVLGDWGVKEGDTIMAHSSWDALAPVMSSIREFLASLLQAVGDSGTLCMPVFPLLKEDDHDAVFSVMRTPSSSGIVTEVFRRMSGVKRSLQMRSVAAIGPRAEYLINDHHKSPFANGVNSPYARFADIGAKVLCLGVPPTTNTMFHCGEDILKGLFPVSIYPARPSVFSVLDEQDRLLKVECFRMLWKWSFVCNSESILKYFSAEAIEYKNICGIECSLTYADRFLSCLLELANNGVHMYRLRSQLDALGMRRRRA